MTRARVPSGEQWLGQIPADWELAPAKSLFDERRQPNSSDDIHLTPSQTHGVLPQSDYVAITGNAVVQNLSGLDNMKHVEPDDFIIHLRSFQGGLERSTLVGKVSTAYTVLSPRDGVLPAYFRWLLKSSAYVQELRTTTNQLRDGQSIKFRDFVKVPLPLPPMCEQRAIADYLDRETALIDALIGEQQRLVAILRERRVAVVAHATAQGPPIEFRRVIRGLRQGWSPNCEASPADGVSEWGVLKVGCCNTGKFDPLQNKRLPDEQAPRQEHAVRRGELVMSRSNTKDLVGAAAVVANDFPRLLLSDLTYGISLTADADPAFVAYALGSPSVRSQISGASKGMSHSMQKISQRDIRELTVRLPPIAEQRRLAAYLDGQTAKVDTLITETEGFIQLSRERRAALITAAVTGQVDLRDGSDGPES